MTGVQAERAISWCESSRTMRIGASVHGFAALSGELMATLKNWKVGARVSGSLSGVS